MELVSVFPELRYSSPTGCVCVCVHVICRVSIPNTLPLCTLSLSHRKWDPIDQISSETPPYLSIPIEELEGGWEPGEIFPLGFTSGLPHCTSGLDSYFLFARFKPLWKINGCALRTASTQSSTQSLYKPTHLTFWREKTVPGIQACYKAIEMKIIRC